MLLFAQVRRATAAVLHHPCGSVLLVCLVLLSIVPFLPASTSYGSAVSFLSSPRDVMDCLPANFSVAASTKIINAFLQIVVVPAVLNPENMLKIPPQALDHVTIDAMTLHHFQLDSASIATGTRQAQSMTFHAAGVGLEVDKSRFVFEYLGIKCYGTFWASLNTTTVDAALLLTLLPAGYWNATFTSVDFAWGTLDVHHELDSKACGLAQKVVELFIGELDAFVAKKVQSKLSEDAPARFAEALNARFADFNLRAITPPLMTTEGMTVTLDANPVPLGCAPAAISSVVPPMPDRDVALRTTVTSINNLLQNALTAGRLEYVDDLPQDLNTSLFEDVIPSVYEACPDCGLTVAVSFKTAPVFVVPHAGAVSVSLTNAIVGLFVRPRTSLEAKALRALAKKSAGAVQTDEDPVLRCIAAAARRLAQLSDYVPVLALNFGAVFAVEDVAAQSGRAISYEVRPLEKLSVGVEASNIGDINTTEIEMVGSEIWNVFVVPLVNARSPVKLPFFLNRALLDLETSDLQAGFSVAAAQLLHRILM